MTKSNINKVLIIRFSSIGDIVLTSPIVRCVKRQLNAEVHFITKSKFATVVSNNPYIDNVITIDKEITEVLSMLKVEKYDLIIDLHKNLRSKRLIYSLGVKSISFDKINIEKWLRVHTRINLLPKNHLVDRYFDGLSKIGIENDGHGLDYFHGVEKERISSLGVPQKYVAIVLGATYFTKRIPIEKVEMFINKLDVPVVLLGGRDVEEVGQQLKGKYPTTINLAGKITLNESAAIIGQSEWAISGDTGLMHIGAALKVPMVAVWGSTAIELGMYPYYGEKNDVAHYYMENENISCNPCSKIGKERCPKGHFKCMMDISEQDVDKAIAAIGKK